MYFVEPQREFVSFDDDFMLKLSEDCFTSRIGEEFHLFARSSRSAVKASGTAILQKPPHRAR